MSHVRKQARTTSSSKDYRTMSPISKQMVSQSDRGLGKTVATCFGIGLTVSMILGLTLIFIIGHSGSIASASGGGSHAATYSGYGSLNHVKGWCGNNSSQPACPTSDPGWFSVASASPTVVATAIAGSEMFASMQSRYGYKTLDAPVLIHAYAAHTGIAYYDDDHWVASVRNAAGKESGIFDFLYDRVNQRLSFSTFGLITPQDPHSRQVFPYTSLSVAIAKLQSQLGLSVKTGTQPALIFFPIDPNFPILSSPVHNWAGGGNSPMNPMWHIIGSDGHDYFVGTDLHVYTQKDLPIAKGQP
jgi:hypothetical protein